MMAWLKENSGLLVALATIVVLVVWNPTGKRIDDLGDHIGSRIDDLNSQIGTRIDDLKGEVRGDIGQLNNQVTRLTDSVDGLRDDVGELGQRISTTEGSVQVFDRTFDHVLQLAIDTQKLLDELKQTN